MVLNRHTWYLTEDLIPLVLFDETLPLKTRTLIALEISKLTSGWIEIRKPTLPSINQKSELIDFVEERPTLLFDKITHKILKIAFLGWKEWARTFESVILAYKW